MKNRSRTEKTIKNTVFNIINQGVSVLLQFILRTVFIQCLALEYLGLNGLFSNILTMLSLTELGLGTAIVCNLYRPIAENNKEKIAVYVNVYKRLYAAIGIVILIVGSILVPFLNYLVKDAPNIPYLRLIYILFLLDSVASYFFAHYRSLLGADQKDYINANNRTLFLVFQTAAQIAVLYIFHNYILYMLIKIGCNLLSGFVISIKVKKMYPFLKNKTDGKISKTEQKNIIRDSSGVFVTKIGMTVLNSTDNIILSSFIGSIITAYYSNYSLIVGTVSTAMGLVFSSVQASIGNYCAVNRQEDNKKMLLNIHYVYFCIYGFCSICLGSLLSPFIKIWLGDQFILAEGIVIAIVAKFYFSNVRQIVLNFMTVNHLLIKLNIKTIIEIIVNLSVSIFLVIKMGIIGIFIGTCFSLLVTSIWYEPFILYKYCFGKGVGKYYLKTFVHMAAAAVGGGVAVVCRNLMFTGGVFSFIICCAVTVIIAGAAVSIPFFRSEEFKYMFCMVKSILLKRRN